MPKKTPKRKHKHFANEKELALPVIHHLKEHGFDVWQEVKFGGPIHDLVAVKGGLVYIVECKLSLTLGVMAQAYFSQHSAHITYIAVPAPDITRRNRMSYLDRRFPLEVCRKFGIGVFYVSVRPDWMSDSVFTSVSIEIPPPQTGSPDDSLYKEQMKNLSVIPKAYCEAGGNTGGYYTPYKGTMKNVQDIITTFPGIGISTIIAKLKGRHHYAHDQSARSSIRNGLKDFEKDWCFIDDSTYPERYYLKSECYCHAGKDGECSWVGCPQLKDGEPKKTGRHCPFDEDDPEA